MKKYKKFYKRCSKNCKQITTFLEVQFLNKVIADVQPYTKICIGS